MTKSIFCLLITVLGVCYSGRAAEQCTVRIVPSANDILQGDTIWLMVELHNQHSRPILLPLPLSLESGTIEVELKRPTKKDFVRIGPRRSGAADVGVILEKPKIAPGKVLRAYELLASGGQAPVFSEPGEVLIRARVHVATGAILSDPVPIRVKALPPVQFDRQGHVAGWLQQSLNVISLPNMSPGEYRAPAANLPEGSTRNLLTWLALISEIPVAQGKPNLEKVLASCDARLKELDDVSSEIARLLMAHALIRRREYAIAQRVLSALSNDSLDRRALVLEVESNLNRR